MFLLSWVPYCSHTHLAGLPGGLPLRLPACKGPPNRFFMCTLRPAREPDSTRARWEEFFQGETQKPRVVSGLRRRSCTAEEVQPCCCVDAGASVLLSSAPIQPLFVGWLIKYSYPGSKPSFEGLHMSCEINGTSCDSTKCNLIASVWRVKA